MKYQFEFFFLVLGIVEKELYLLKKIRISIIVSNRNAIWNLRFMTFLVGIEIKNN